MNTSNLVTRLTPVALLALLGACSSEGTSPLDAGTGDASSPVDGGPSDSGTAPSDAGSGGSDTAILDRPLDRRYTCAVAVPTTKQAPRQWSSGGHTLVTRAGEAMLVRTESSPPSPFEPAPVSLVFGALLADGSLSGPEAVTVLPDFGAGEPVAAEVGEELLMVWNQESALYAAHDGPAGVSGPRAIAGLTGAPSMRKVMVAGHGGAGLVFSAGDLGQSDVHLAFARLDGTGQLVAGPVMIEPSLGVDPAPAIVATDDGWAVLYRDDQGVVLRTLAADGTPGAKHTLATESGSTWLARSSGFDRAQLALLGTPAGFLAAWVEADVLRESGANAGIRVARLDASGATVEGPVWVHAPTADVDEGEPRLSWHGESVALTWARGAHIYICGGCVPDHAIELLLFDPATLAPQSEVVALAPGMTGGLLRRAEAWIGSELRLAFEITLHVTADPGTAVLRCTP